MRVTTVVAALALSLTAIASAPAQSLTDHDGVGAPGREALSLPLAEPEPDEGFSFGSGTQDHVVLASSCQRWTATPYWIHGNFRFFGNDIAVASNAECPVTLPNGARITGMECTVEDSTAAGNIDISLLRGAYDVTTSAPVASATLATVISSGATGYQVVSTTLANPVTVRHRNGNLRYIYVLHVSLPADVVANVGLRDCTILWNRQVAPAPLTATFSDVPSGHPQRQFVEALVAAGITGGCGGGNYCPDSPLTRGQMAVFLSVALGLHFPN